MITDPAVRHEAANIEPTGSILSVQLRFLCNKLVRDKGWLLYRGSTADIELGSHHGSQQGSAAVSSHEGDAEGGEGDEPDADEVAAKADFTPMTDEKRVFVTEWIAKLGDEGFEDDAVSCYTAHNGKSCLSRVLQCHFCIIHMRASVKVQSHSFG